MSAVLLADVGGSKTRLALANATGPPDRIRVIENDTVADLETAVTQYLEHTGERPQSATFAVAGPIQAEDVALTNRPWRFRRSEFAKRFGFLQFRIVNDFEAVAWALPRLTAAQTRPLGTPSLRPHGVKVVLGPGTGLGVAALVQADAHSVVVASEGGHASFGAHTSEEEDLFIRLRQHYGPVSAETLLSGPGLLRLARTLHPERSYGVPESVLAEARAGEPAAEEIARVFVRLLGRFAGDIALTFKALGGVYITGGVAFGLGPLLDAPEFRTAFEQHPPYQELLRGVATLLVTSREPGLIGCAALSQMHTSAPI
ncbi:MAG TPA: glucokinase [Xanthobacteraceae bacterium]|jgi:glucokinase